MRGVGAGHNSGRGRDWPYVRIVDTGLISQLDRACGRIVEKRIDAIHRDGDVILLISSITARIVEVGGRIDHTVVGMWRAAQDDAAHRVPVGRRITGKAAGPFATKREIMSCSDA